MENRTEPFNWSRMNQGFFRTTKFLDLISNTDTAEKVEIPEGKCKEIACDSYYAQNFHDNFLLTIDENIIDVYDIISGNHHTYRFDQRFLPIITTDFNEFQNSWWVCTTKGVILHMSQSGVIDDYQLDFVPTAFDFSESSLFIGNIYGELYNYTRDGQIEWRVNEPKTFKEKLISMTFFAPKNPVLAITSNSKFVYMVTEKGNFYVYNRETAKKCHMYTLSSKLQSALLKSSDLYVYAVLTTEKSSNFKRLNSLKDYSADIQLTRPRINDFDFNEENLIMICQDEKATEVNLYDNNLGKFLSCIWLPKDDAELMTGRRVMPDFVLSKYFDSLQKDFLLEARHVAFDEKHNIWISNASSLLIARRMQRYEEYVLDSKYNRHQNQIDIISIALKFALAVSIKHWNDFDSELRLNVDPNLISHRIARLYSECSINLQISMDEIIEQITNFVNDVRIDGMSENEDLTTPYLFWQSATTQVIMAHSTISRCLLILVQYFIIKNKSAKYSKVLHQLSRLVLEYTKLEVLCDYNAIIATESLFYEPGIDMEMIIRNNLSNLKNVENVTSALLEDGKHNAQAVCDFLLLCEKPSINKAIALYYLEKYNESVKYVVAYQDLINLSKVKEILIPNLVKLRRDDLVSKLAQLDPIGNCSILFRSYINLKDYDSAFNCIQNASTKEQQVDLMRYFIRHLMKNGKISKIMSYPWNSNISIFTNELLCYSRDTVSAAILFYKELDDKSQTASSLYFYARQYLHDPTKDNLKLAASALVLCLSIMSHSETVIRNVSTNKLVKPKKISKLLARINCCLYADDPKKASKCNNIELLHIALKHSITSMISFINSGISTNDVVAFLKELAHEKNFKALSSFFFGVERPDLNSVAFENVYTVFLKEKIDPPAWFICSMKDKAIRQLFVISAQYNRQNIIIDILKDMRDNGEKLPSYLLPIVKNINVSDELIKGLQ